MTFKGAIPDFYIIVIMTLKVQFEYFLHSPQLRHDLSPLVSHGTRCGLSWNHFHFSFISLAETFDQCRRRGIWNFQKISRWQSEENARYTAKLQAPTKTWTRALALVADACLDSGHANHVSPQQSYSSSLVPSLKLWRLK